LTTITYNPRGTYSINITEEIYIQDGEESFKARIYQPEGAGPFPVLLDVHGGAWQGGTRFNGYYMDEKLAESGVLVAAIDFRVAPKDPYPAQVIDVNYGARWWKNESKVYNGDSSSFGILGVSSGGHTAMLNALCPARPDYIKRPFLVNEAPVDASVDYYIGISAVLDSHARYLYAKDEGMESLIRGSLAYFGDEERMKSGSPQYILENGEFERLPTSLLIHGSEDANVPNHIPVNFELTYQSRGGELELVIFDGMPHSFVRDPQPESDEAIEIMKNFIARQL
jgi:acetyl esterase/lipase